MVPTTHGHEDEHEPARRAPITGKPMKVAEMIAAWTAPST